MLPNTSPVVVTSVDAAAACGMTGATRVELLASRVGCVQPLPAPCTATNPPVPMVGTVVDCPSTDAAAQLSVELSQAGRYHLAVVTRAGEDELVRACVGEGGEVEMLVDDDRFADNPTIMASDLGTAACM